MNVSLPDNPRTMQVVLTRIIDRLRLRRITQASNCRYCNLSGIDSRMRELKWEIKESDNPREVVWLKHELGAIAARRSLSRDHAKRKSHQRAFIQGVRDILEPDELMVWMDFLSWHRADGGGKIQDLVMVLQWRENGALVTHYLDITCSDSRTQAHTHLYLFHAYHVLFDETTFLKRGSTYRFRKIYRVSDNGRPFVTRFSCWIESYFQCKTGVQIVVYPLCPHHTWSLCDSHGGAVKPLCKATEIRDNFPLSDRAFKNMIEEHVAHTDCFPQHRIAVEKLTGIYNQFGGISQVGPICGISQVGHIEYMQGPVGTSVISDWF